MKRLTRNIKNLLCLTAAGGLMLTGCADDVFPGGEQGEGDITRGAVIYVPDVTGSIRNASATRSIDNLSDPQDAEKAIKNLYLFAYPVAGKDGEKDVFKLSELTPLTQVADEFEGYTGYKLQLTNGNYHMYVVANVEFSEAEVTKATMISEYLLKKYTVTAPATAAEVTSKGLPMSCSNTELDLKYSDQSVFSDVTDATGIVVDSNTGVQIKADLTFSVAKVRVTLLNDIFPTKQISSTTISNVPEKVDVFTESGNSQTLGEGAFAKSGYSGWGDIANNDDPLKVEIDGLTLSETAPAGSWIWQGVTYVGERLFASTATNKPIVTLNFTDNSNKEVALGSDDKGGLKRSYFYDYVGTPTTEFKLAVQQWTPETIMGALHGAYYLHVDTTEIPKMESGKSVAIWYDSNASLDFNFEKVTKNGVTFDVYTKKLSNDTIYLSLNSRLSSGDEALVGDKYKSFTITAGTIEKKLTVEEMNLQEYMEVDKESDEINVRTVVASGNYSGTTYVTVSSNLAQVEVEKVASSWESTGIDQALTLTEGTYNVDAESGEVRIPLNYKNLNGGAYWNDMHTVSFKIKGTVNGSPEEKTINVTVVPSTDDYTIYLYAPTWNNAHIYVYQCLKLPSTHPLYPNAPLGVYNKDNRAALEYNFTGGLAFRGWGVAGDDGVNHNDPAKYIKKSDDGYNFYVFDGENNPCVGHWNMTDGDGLKDHYYFVDFYSSYRSGITDCKCKDVQRDFPGLKMEKVKSTEQPGDGWWKINLTGIAKPGQALIMFCECDGNHENWSDRYPDDSAPGLPLFDFPNKIGYIDATAFNPQFVNEKPLELGIKTFKITYTNPSGWNKVYVHYENKRGNSTWPGVEMTKEGSNWVADIPEGTTKIWFNYGSNRHQTSDEGITPVTSRVYTDACKKNHDCSIRTIYFRDDWNWGDNVYIYTWTGSTQQMGGWPGTKMTRDSNGGGNWWKIDIPDSVDNIQFTNNSGSQTGTITIKDTDDQYYCSNGSHWNTGY